MVKLIELKNTREGERQIYFPEKTFIVSEIKTINKPCTDQWIVACRIKRTALQDADLWSGRYPPFRGFYVFLLLGLLYRHCLGVQGQVGELNHFADIGGTVHRRRLPQFDLWRKGLQARRGRCDRLYLMLLSLCKLAKHWWGFWLRFEVWIRKGRETV